MMLSLLHVFFFAGTLFAQVNITYESHNPESYRPPASANEQHWHIRPSLKLVVIRYGSSRGTIWVDSLSEFTPLGDCFVLERPKSGKRCNIYHADGTLIHSGVEMKAFGRMVVEQGMYYTNFYDEKGKLVGVNDKVKLINLEPDTVAGHAGFCVAMLTAGLSSFPSSQWNTWGFLSTSGRWVIEPIFDEPFSFEKGKAKVMYYGQARTINALGAFLD